ncbi:MAG: hypothetical protein FJ206_05385 [Gemmatimonadetes bacterium]|nr:hypothetical protein [Gemmatimonadota bacterium]
MVALITVIAGVVGIVAFVMDRRTDAPPAPRCVDAVGRWDWLSTGGVVAVAEDRGLHWYRVSADPLPTINGVWECDEEDPHRFTFRWRETGYVDTLTLSEDRARFIGANQQTGFKLSGTRAR